MIRKDLFEKLRGMRGNPAIMNLVKKQNQTSTAEKADFFGEYKKVDARIK